MRDKGYILKKVPTELDHPGNMRAVPAIEPHGSSNLIGKLERTLGIPDNRPGNDNRLRLEIGPLHDSHRDPLQAPLPDRCNHVGMAYRAGQPATLQVVFKSVHAA